MVDYSRNKALISPACYLVSLLRLKKKKRKKKVISEWKTSGPSKLIFQRVVSLNAFF